MTEQFRLEDFEDPIRDIAKAALGDLYGAINEQGLAGSVMGYSVVTERTPKLSRTSATTTIYRAGVVDQIDPRLFHAPEPPTYLRYMVSVLCDELTEYLNIRHNGRGQAQLYPPNEKALQRQFDTEWFSLRNSDRTGAYDIQLYHTKAFHDIGLHLARPDMSESWSIEYGYRVNTVFPHAIIAEMPGEVTEA